MTRIKDDMRPGDLRLFQAKAIVLSIGLWPKRRGKHLRIDITGTGGHTTIENNPTSKRYHRTLFRNFRRVLIEQGRWPFGAEGAETEQE
jgi:hypothetical protein